MTSAEYSPAVARLLTYGDCSKMKSVPDYVGKLGLDPTHVPELLRMATDPELQWCESNRLAVWAPIHAVRCLGQLRAAAACEPLLKMLPDALQNDDDWFIEALPPMFANIGEAAIPILEEHLARLKTSENFRIIIAESLGAVGKKNPSCRDECVDVLESQLEIPARNGQDVNGFIIISLCDLKAVEALPAIRQAFEYGVVNTRTTDWDEVKQHLDLPKSEPDPVQRSGFRPRPKW